MYTLKERKDRVRFLTKRKNKFQKIYEDGNNKRNDIIAKKRSEIFDILGSDTISYDVTNFSSRTLHITAKDGEGQQVYYRPRIIIDFGEKYDYDTNPYERTCYFDKVDIQNFKVIGKTSSQCENDYHGIDVVVKGLNIFTEIAENYNIEEDGNFIDNIVKFWNELETGFERRNRKIGKIVAVIEAEIRTHTSEMENDKIRPFIKKGVWFKRTMVDDNGRNVKSMYYHIFKITAKCTFFNEFDQNGRNTRKDDNYWNENEACRRLTHNEFVSQVRSTDYGNGVYITKEYTPKETTRRYYGGFIKEIKEV